jgi:hypothetical protein
MVVFSNVENVRFLRLRLKGITQATMKRVSHSEVKLMAVRQPRYSKEEFAQRGDALYESEVRAQVEEGNHGKIVAIDLETGDFEVDASEIAACFGIAYRR